MPDCRQNLELLSGFMNFDKRDGLKLHEIRQTLCEPDTRNASPPSRWITHTLTYDFTTSAWLRIPASQAGSMLFRVNVSITRVGFPRSAHPETASRTTSNR
jgi:hypothetical protein